ncbi:heavy metal transport/detoxification superfamily protein [Actinidia rufa]|uniref:Heavy metal transport/detoxification superfamily protein n=1 Tax=Actinidia rufa TaxID=165716 RepID=A0A7J0FXB4_9ERIC|nr:heavy metal transport/detoxification superfamily protein [Actinidia rufa]
MVLKVVDLHCYSCYKKIKKVLCKFPEIRNQVYDEKANTVTITVVCCNPEKIRDKLYCKCGKAITSIEINPHPHPPPPSKPKVTPESPKPPPPPPPPPSHECKCKPAKPPPPPPHECKCKPPPPPPPYECKCKTKVLVPPAPAPAPAPAPTPTPTPAPTPPPAPVVCCRQCSEGHSGGPCYRWYGRPVPCYDGLCEREEEGWIDHPDTSTSSGDYSCPRCLNATACKTATSMTIIAEEEDILDHHVRKMNDTIPTATPSLLVLIILKINFENIYFGPLNVILAPSTTTYKDALISVGTTSTNLTALPQEEILEDKVADDEDTNCPVIKLSIEDNCPVIRQPWKQSLVLKVIGRSFSPQQLMYHLHAFWNTAAAQPTVIALAAGFMLVKILSDEETTNELLRVCGP